MRYIACCSAKESQMAARGSRNYAPPATYPKTAKVHKKGTPGALARKSRVWCGCSSCIPGDDRPGFTCLAVVILPKLLESNDD